MLKVTTFTLLLASAVQGYIFGLNMPWNNCGNDFGSYYNADAFEQAFAKYRSNGASVVRVWDHYDGNKSLSLYSNGYFRTLPSIYYSNIKDMLLRARNHSLQVVLSVFSFECVNNSDCRSMIEDQGKQNAYIQNGLIPLLDFIVQQQVHDQVYAIELFNEPEWMIVGGEDVTSTIGLASVQQFVAKVNQVVTSKGFKATIGSASYKWTCNCGKWCAGDWWGSTGISFYSVHYYDWMVDNGNTFDPFNTSPSDWCLNRPVLIGESPGWTGNSLKGQITVENQVWLAAQRGYIGVLPWCDKCGSDYDEISKGLSCQWHMSSCKPSYAAKTNFRTISS